MVTETATTSPSTLFLLDTATGERVEVIDVAPNGVGNSLGYDQAGGWIYFTESETDEDIYLMEKEQRER